MKRRRFGTLIIRQSKDGTRKYVEARYQPPIWAYGEWPNLPKHFSKRFDVDYTAMAEAWLAEEERKIRLGTWEPPKVSENKSRASRITFREYALDYVENRRKPDGERIAETTREKYLQYLKDYLIPVLGGKPMADITPRDIERWSDSMKIGASGELAPIKAKTLTLLRAIFKDACERPLDSSGTTLLTINPVRIRMPKRTSNIAYADISMTELDTLYHAMKPRLAVLIYLIGAMGLRPGEAYALQRRDVELNDDLTSGVLHITKAAKPIRVADSETGEGHRKIVIGSTKTEGSLRDVELPPFLCKALDRHLKQYVPDKPDAYLFTGERTLSIISDQTVRNAWYQARKSVPRLEARKVRLYDLRHRSISYMKKYTSSDKTVMGVAGHIRLDTDRHYQHQLESERRKIIDGIEREAEESGISTPAEAAPDADVSHLVDLLEKTTASARVEIIRKMDAHERDAVMQRFSQKTREETLSCLFKAS